MWVSNADEVVPEQDLSSARETEDLGSRSRALTYRSFCHIRNNSMKAVRRTVIMAVLTVHHSTLS